jgi:RimJ/RimL family protein N-acetyltransferase
VINFIPGDAGMISDIALAHRDLAGVHFTGSTGVFNSMWKTIGSNMGTYKSYPRIVGETGGKDFIVVHPSADPQAVAVGIVRGAFQGCNLGYALDGTCQGQGLMHEALRAVLDEAFSPRLNLHRIQAGVRPENHRSLAVLARLGFRGIGLARHYLFIHGDWRDHQLFELINPSFVQPADW